MAAWRDDDGGRAGVGYRIELRRGARIRHGTVEYAQRDNVLIKWDDGGANTLRLHADRDSPVQRRRPA